MRPEPFLIGAAGKKRFFLNMTVEDIESEEVAHHLSMINRFNGALSRPITVAQHSIEVSRIAYAIDPLAAKWGLIHDISEAYVGDIITPLKRELGLIVRVEEAIQKTVIARYEALFDDEIAEAVRRADAIAMTYELEKFHPHARAYWECGVTKDFANDIDGLWNNKIGSPRVYQEGVMSANEAKDRFLNALHWLEESSDNFDPWGV